MATVGQRDELLRQNTGLQIKLYGGEFARERLLGGLAQASSVVLGAVVLSLLIGMLGKNWETISIFGMDAPLELVVALGLFGGGLTASVGSGAAPPSSRRTSAKTGPAPTT